MNTEYAIGTRVSLTPLALAHFSMMSMDESWIGCFMYPILSSFRCAPAGVVTAGNSAATKEAIAIRHATANFICMAFALPTVRPELLFGVRVRPALNSNYIAALAQRQGKSRALRRDRHPIDTRRSQGAADRRFAALPLVR
jgi:hypothetical protein